MSTAYNQFNWVRGAPLKLSQKPIKLKCNSTSARLHVLARELLQVPMYAFYLKPVSNKRLGVLLCVHFVQSPVGGICQRLCAYSLLLFVWRSGTFGCTRTFRHFIGIHHISCMYNTIDTVFHSRSSLSYMKDSLTFSVVIMRIHLLTDISAILPVAPFCATDAHKYNTYTIYMIKHRQSPRSQPKSSHENKTKTHSAIQTALINLTGFHALWGGAWAEVSQAACSMYIVLGCICVCMRFGACR